ncbi:MAG: thioredoxin domain-containing protein [Aureliella sp.]
MPNRLANATSPYLLQHQHNPVDWYPWGAEALQAAKTQDRPIFLSIGYSACHWCHVMERESFENPQIAEFLNQHFVAIKVDREERPDLDQIYMQAVQMLTGSGGWPMSVFLTPEGKPFFGGTYWPPEDRWGRPGFAKVLAAIANAWQTQREQVDAQSQQITDYLHTSVHGPGPLEGELKREWIFAADRWHQEHFDPKWGGFGAAPKFPHCMALSLLIELCATTPNERRRHVVCHTLDCMAAGGLYDHLAGGFARYSVDEKWLVPHFEKMLYDNALLAGCYADAYRLWREPEFARVASETLDYLIRDMQLPGGGICSAEDADSEGVEGKFYVWALDEVKQALGAERAAEFCRAYDVTERGNFEGHNILNRPQPLAEVARQLNQDPEEFRQRLAEDRAELLRIRNTRVRPGRDDKVLLGWNALALTGLCKGYRAVGELRFLHAAQEVAHFLRREMRSSCGRLVHAWRDGRGSLAAYLDDYATLLDALVELYQCDFDQEWLDWACELGQIMLSRFRDPAGGFYFTADDHEQLITRSKDAVESSVPSGSAMAASGLLALGRLVEREDFIQAAHDTLAAASGLLSAAPQAAAQSLRALQRWFDEDTHLVLIGGDDENEWQAACRACRAALIPHGVVIGARSAASAGGNLAAHFAGRVAQGDRTTLYICRQHTCEAPAVGLADILQALARWQKPQTAA